MAKKKERMCPCGSKIQFSNCCKYPKVGNTPEEIQDKITKIVIATFNDIRENRGETCLYVSTLIKDLLNELGIKSYVVAGASKWKYVSHFYDWNPPIQFHVWVVTEYGETVDLACDALDKRGDMLGNIGVNTPTRCWKKELDDREYIPKDLGARSFKFDKGYTTIKKHAFKLLGK
ncbi:hypothetical protein [Bacillus cereus]|uniref:hypothetical protein n=1 Tax=Bacillus cereus TaxID=1396 RepID=UPI000BF52921|nr:hypothetical protein [Bacillus cereus]PET96226.1 hypothetical protein CN534_23830 [Bacillus cereus]PEZ54705.1 hypothetical protein CN370_27500 [Bacillus cereus]PFB62378.1 hypothetical protein CN292_26985 [Bacillus cereus]HDR8152414.1 hypothetical protein [Bacillus cereus]